jgi:hypothetical protein
MGIARFLELDIMQSNELIDGINLAVNNKIPTIIVHQDLAQEAKNGRLARQGNFKIITPIGWPDGKKYGMEKVHMVKTDAIDVDGFEIILKEDDHPDNIKREIEILSSFIRNDLFQKLEVRIVLETISRKEENIEKTLEAISRTVKPDLIRNDHNTRAQQKSASAKIHLSTMDIVKNRTNINYKISGNISNIRTIAQCHKATAFGVNLKQAKNLIKEDKEDPKKLNQLINELSKEEENAKRGQTS